MTIQQIVQRKPQMQARNEMVSAQMQTAMDPHEENINSRFKKITSGTESRKIKMFKLMELMSDTRAIIAPLTACQSGCSTCCYQQVLMSQTEADVIGHKIGKTAKQLRPGYKEPGIRHFGRDTPCGFLVDSKCSIYDARPMVCRNMVSWDIDSLLCGFENWDLGNAKDPRFVPLPMLSMGPMEGAYKTLSGKDVVGDIRDFFPVNS